MQIPNSFANQDFIPNVANLDFQSSIRPYPMPNGLPMPLNMMNLSVPFATPVLFPAQHMTNVMQANYYNMLMMWKLQNDMHGQIVKSQLSQLIEAKENATRAFLKGSSPLGQVNLESVLKPAFVPNQFLPELCDSNKSTKAHLKDMIYFVLNNLGTINEEEMKMEGLKYRNNKELLQVFEALLSKYVSTMKTKEEMIKHLFKKAVKYMKQMVKKEMKKGATEDSTGEKREFKAFLEQMSLKIEEDTDESENTNKQVPSAKQSSKNNNISSEVITEAFSSEEFFQGFQEYVQSLDRTLELDNNKKIDKFIKFIESSLKRNTIKDVKKYKRIPWLKIWVQNTKRLAYDLLYVHHNEDCFEEKKILKKEEYSITYESSSDDTYQAKLEEDSL